MGKLTNVLKLHQAGSANHGDLMKKRDEIEPAQEYAPPTSSNYVRGLAFGEAGVGHNGKEPGSKRGGGRGRHGAMNSSPIGFWGDENMDNYEPRMVNAERAFHKRCTCIPDVRYSEQCHLTHYQFGQEMMTHFKRRGEVQGYDGPCWSPYLYFEIAWRGIRYDPESGRADAIRLAQFLLARYSNLNEASLLVFHAGWHGFQIALPLSLCGVLPATLNFHLVSRRMAENLSREAGVAIKPHLYEKLGMLLAPNAEDWRGGVKRRFKLNELRDLGSEPFRRRTLTAEPFEVPDYPPPDEVAVRDWQTAADELNREEMSGSAAKLTGEAAKPAHPSSDQSLDDRAPVSPSPELLARLQATSSGQHPEGQ